MNVSEIFIRRPVATTLLTCGIVLAGVAAYFQLPVSPLPQVDFPTIVVSATMAGASPETMASSVASPLERHLGEIADVTEMTSQSALGSTSITLQFGLNRNIDGAARDVQAAISGARVDLPAALRSNPTYRKTNPADSPILVLALESETMSSGQLYDAASTLLQQPLSQVSGVGDVTVGGSSLPAVRVELNPPMLAKYGIGMEDVRAALAAANANSPKGSIENAEHHWQIYDNDQAHTADMYRPLVVAYRNGAAVRLRDVADVEESVEDIHQFGVSGGHPAVLITISRQPGANIIATVDRIMALLPALQASIPAATVSVASDRSITIRASLVAVEKTLAIAVILVILVVYAFLRDWRATLIPGVAVPVSLIGTFSAMFFLHYSLDNLSLMALTVATGFVVDDAIVVMENIVRHMEGGMPRMQATLVGVRQVGFTVVSMTLSLIAVFIPILLMPGIVGRFFREFAITLSVAIVVSLVLSLTMTPMLCSRFLGSHGVTKTGRFHQWSDAFFADMLNTYRSSLGWVLRHGALIMGLLALTVGLNIWLFTIIPKGFLPEQDTGRLEGGVSADQSISFQLLSQKLRKFVDIIATDPDVTTVVGTAGTGWHGGPSGHFNIALKPLGERKGSSQDVITRLRPKLAVVPGATLYLSPAQEVHIGGHQSDSMYQFTLQGDDVQELRDWTPKLVDALKDEPVLQDVHSDQQDRGLETDLLIDRTTASRLGLSASQIDNALYDAFGQRQVSTIYEDLNQYHVVMVAAQKYWLDPGALKDVYVSTSGGAVGGTQATNAVAGTVTSGSARNASALAAADTARNAALNSIAATGKTSASTGQAVTTRKENMVPLSAFTHYGMGITPVQVNHTGQFVATTITFNIDPDASMSDAVAAVYRQVAAIHMPGTINGTFAGNLSTYQKTLNSEPVLVLAAIVAVYLVLGILYESYAHPLTILSTLPSAGIGAVLALMLFNTDFSLIALIGVFLLIGIVKKNAIMMIDFAVEAQREEGLAPHDAIFKAALLRFRPIMMTTMAALFGAVPLAVGAGDGAEMRRPLGISIVGGLIMSQLLTLYTTPVVFLYVSRMSAWFNRMRVRFA